MIFSSVSNSSHQPLDKTINIFCVEIDLEQICSTYLYWPPNRTACPILLLNFAWSPLSKIVDRMLLHSKFAEKLDSYLKPTYMKFMSSIVQSLRLCSVQLKPLFWFRSNTETETQNRWHFWLGWVWVWVRLGLC